MPIRVFMSLLTLGLVSCSEPSDSESFDSRSGPLTLEETLPPELRESPPPIAKEAPVSALAEELGLAQAVWRDLGPVEVRERPEVTTEADRHLAEVTQFEHRTDADVPDDSVGFYAVDLVEQRKYHVWVPPDALEALAKEAIERGLANGAPALDADGRELDDSAFPDTSERSSRVEKTWSDGTWDNVRLGTQDGLAWDHPRYRKIGWLPSDGCTGSLIGSTRRIVLTAAHCLWDGSGTLLWQDFHPRRNGGTDNYPTQSAVWAYWPTGYDSDCQQGLNSATCNKFDIAVIVTEEPGTPHPGTFSYGYLNDDDFGDEAIWMRGYPGCGSVESPPNCTTGATYPTLFGTPYPTLPCVPVSFTSADSNGDDREVSVTCDGARGMSGAPFYQWYDGAYVVIGEYSQYDCLGAACSGNSDPNKMTRITLEYKNWIASIASAW